MLHNTFVVSQETSAIIVIFTFSLHFLCQQFSCFLLTHILFYFWLQCTYIVFTLISVFMQIKERYFSEEVSLHIVQINTQYFSYITMRVNYYYILLPKIISLLELKQHVELDVCTQDMSLEKNAFC